MAILRLVQPVSGVPLIATVLDAKLRFVAQKSLSSEARIGEMIVESGDYLVRVERPSGNAFSREVSVIFDNQLVEITLEPDQPSPHEWLHRQHAQGTLPNGRAATRLTSVAPRHPFDLGAMTLGLNPSLDANKVWLRVWQKDKAWTLVSDPRKYVDSMVTDDDYALLRFHLPGGFTHAVQFGGPTTAWRIVMLPGFTSGFELVLARDLTGERQGAFEPVLDTDDDLLDSLLHTLAAPAAAHPEEVWNQCAGAVAGTEQVLRRKLHDPVRAALGGYFLLRFQMLEHLSNLPRLLTDCFPDLPDGPVIHAWQLLHDPKRFDLDRAADRLLEAVTRGIPCFAEGLQLLADGLRLVIRQVDVWRSKVDETAVGEGLERLRPYLAAARPVSAFTGFYGRAPDRPTILPHVGDKFDTKTLQLIFPSKSDLYTLPSPVMMTRQLTTRDPSEAILMSRFVRLTVSDFVRLIDSFEWKRRVQAVHVHHTWRPNHVQWQGLKSVEGMWRVHTQTNGWSDIAQHITIDPEGFVWTGRNWNQPPASAKGFNGTATAGPFMFETVGDFDLGQDPFGGAQKETALKVTACLLDRFELGIEAVRFHNEMSPKSCPGTGIDRLSFLAEVKARRSPGGARTRRARGDSDALTYDRQSIEAVRKLIESGPQVEEPEDSEPDDGPERVLERAVPSMGAIPREGLSTADRQKLRRHVINSRDGRLSTDGLFTTSAADVERIFAEHIPTFAQGLEAGKPLRLAFYAHGGLNNEETGLQIALNQVDWWLANGVYPLFFVWETGFLETLGQILSPSRALLPSGRGFGSDLRDRATEVVAHNLGGVGIWSQMKLAAARGVDPGGATTITVAALHGLLDVLNDRPVELHAVGHSAGSIFHSWFIPAVAARAGTTFKTLSFLAPAIRVDDFALHLLPTMGGAVARTTIFTMVKDLELADSLGPFYGKSLLYLIYHALEPDTETPILGLDECLHADTRLRQAFGLMGQSSAAGGSVVWSRTQVTSGPDASTATSHGGFDNDVPTMNSVIRRVLGLNHEPLEQEFPTGTRAAPATVMLRDPIEYLPEPYRTRLAASAWPTQPPSPMPAMTSAIQVPTTPMIITTSVSGQRRALCVGINAYPTAPLGGCVADAQLWARSLGELGFADPLLLMDGDARRERILGELERLIGSSGPGDQVAFQYSGHGTQLDDTDADEDDALDEAICPVDFDEGAFIIDDDFAQLFARIPDGVAVTCFFDCCHSGTNTRLAVGRPGSVSVGARPRFIRATPQMQERHKAFRAQSARRSLERSGDRSRMRQVVFSACRPDEVAWENAGQGDFTRLAVPLLARSVGMPHRRFVEVVLQAFGAGRRQTPELDCADGMRDQPLLGAPPNGGRVGGVSTISRDVAASGSAVEAWARVADAMAAALRTGS